MSAPVCSVLGCSRGAAQDGRCRAHYSRRWRLRVSDLSDALTGLLEQWEALRPLAERAVRQAERAEGTAARAARLAYQCQLQRAELETLRAQVRGLEERTAALEDLLRRGAA